MNKKLDKLNEMPVKNTNKNVNILIQTNYGYTNG